MTSSSTLPIATAADVASIRVGSRIAFTLDGKTYGPARVVSSIHYQGEDIAGAPFVCGYHESGSGNGWWSFSIKAGAQMFYRIENE